MSTHSDLSIGAEVLQLIVRNTRENAQNFELRLTAAMRQNGFFFAKQ
jgi:hypothetical protein